MNGVERVSFTLKSERLHTMDIRAQIIDQFSEVAREQERQLPPLTDELQLLESGLDSLCFAIVVARLEDKLGVDPFNADDVLFPATFGEFVKCYESIAK
jgi:acyl carrier protein